MSHFTTNTKLDIINYVALTEAIAEGFFDENDNYVPHYGKLNAMRIFYNQCVTDSDYEDKISHDVVHPMLMDELLSDENFIQAFEEALSGTATTTFGAAYYDALEIVDYRKRSATTLINHVTKQLNELIAQITSAVTPDMLEQAAKIADDIKTGNLSADSIVKAYENSQRFKDVVSGKESEVHIPSVAEGE